MATTPGQHIKRHRGKLGLTQRDLAAALRVDAGTISRWERGTHAPTNGHRAALADVLGGKPTDYRSRP